MQAVMMIRGLGRKPNLVIGIIVASSVLINIVHFILTCPHPAPQNDQLLYHNTALQIVPDFSIVFDGTRIPPGLIIRSYGYPLLIALVYRLAGAPSPGYIAFVQSVFFLPLTVFLTYRLGRKVLSPAIGLLAAGLFSFYLPLVWHAQLLLTETFYALLTTLFLLMLACLLETARSSTAMVAGVLLALLSISHSAWQFLVWIMLPLIVFSLLQRHDRLRSRNASLAAVVGAMLVIAPLQVMRIRHNLPGMGQGGFGYGSGGGWTFYVGSRAETRGLAVTEDYMLSSTYPSPRHLAALHDKIQRKEVILEPVIAQILSRKLASPNEADHFLRDPDYYRAGLINWLDEPRQIPGLILDKASFFLLSEGNTLHAGYPASALSGPRWEGLFHWLRAPLLILGFVGFAILFAGYRGQMVLFVPLVFQTLVPLLSSPEVRYQYPNLPTLFLLAALAMAKIQGNGRTVSRETRASSRFIILAIAASLLLSAWMKPSIGTFRDHFDMYEGYTLAALDSLHPGFLTHDYFFGIGHFFKIMPAVYDALNRSFALLAGDVLRAEKWLWILCTTVFVPGVYLIIRRVCPDRVIAFLIAWASVGKGTLTVTGAAWGIQPHILPLVLYEAILPLLFLLAWTIGASTGSSRIIRLGLPAVLGLLVGLSNEIHPVSALGAAELFGAFLLWHVLCRRLPMRSVIVYGVCLAPGFLVRSLSVVQSSEWMPQGQRVIEDTLIKVGSQGGMLFPWVARKGLGWGTFFHASTGSAIAAVVIAYAFLALTCLGGLLIHRRRHQGIHRGWLITLVLANMCWMSFLISMFSLVFFTGFLFLHRAWRREMDQTDWTLLMLWTVSLALGVIQQMALLGLWRLTHITLIALTAYETARFGTFIYAIAYFVLARSIVVLISPISQSLARYATAVGLLLIVIMGQTRYVPIHGRIIESPSHPHLADYLELTSWIGRNIEINRIVYINDAPVFRALSLHPVTHSTADLTRAIHAGLRPDQIQRRITHFTAAAANPVSLMKVVRKSGASLIALPASTPYRLELPIAYSNPSFLLYSVPPAPRTSPEDPVTGSSEHKQ